MAFLPCGCPLSLFEDPISGRSASMTLHGMMVTYGGCQMLDMPEQMRADIIAARPTPSGDCVAAPPESQAGGAAAWAPPSHVAPPHPTGSLPMPQADLLALPLPQEPLPLPMPLADQLPLPQEPLQQLGAPVNGFQPSPMPPAWVPQQDQSHG